MGQTPAKLLLIDLEGLPAPWQALEAMPCLQGLAPRAAWGEGLARDWSGLGAALRQAGLSAGLFNLSGASPPADLPGWWVARPSGVDQGQVRVQPPDLALDLADYLGGQIALSYQPPPRPHQRDEAFAQWACLARLVWEHAQRLLARRPPDLAGVGFQGLAQVAGLFAQDPGRVALYLAQIDHYIERLMDQLRPSALMCLGEGSSFLAWAPGRLPPGRMAALSPDGLAGLTLELLR